MTNTTSTTESRPAKVRNGITSSLSATDEDITPNAKSQRRLSVGTQQTKVPPNYKLISQTKGEFDIGAINNLMLFYSQAAVHHSGISP